MTGKTLTTFRTDLRTDIQGSITEFPDASVDRAVERAVAELSKFLPFEKVLDVFIGDRTVTDEAFTSSDDTDVSLANSPIQGQTEQVRSATGGGGTLFTLGTDYEMNYFNGTIKTLSIGSIVDATVTYISYEKNGIVVDISAATNIMEVLRLESPIDSRTYQEIKSFQLWDTKIFIGAGMKESQMKLLENKNFWMYYTTEWTTPVAGTGSEYPAHLDELVSKGSLGFLLSGLAAKQYQTAVTELVLANAELDETDGNFTSAAAIFTDLDIALVAANAALDEISWTLFLAMIDHASNDDAVVNLIAANTALDALTSEGFTDFDTALAAANTALDAGKVFADAVNDASGGAALDKVELQINAATDSVEENEVNAQADLTTGTDTYLAGGVAPSGQKYLVDGDGFLNQVNVGENVAENHVQYSLASIRMSEAYVAAASVAQGLGANRLGSAQAFIQEGLARNDAERLNIQAANVLAALGQQFIGEAESRLSQHRILVQQAQAYINTGLGYVEAANSYVAQNLAFVREAEGYISEARARQATHSLYMDEVDRHNVDARGRLETASGYNEVGNKYSELAQTHMNEFFDGLRERAGMRRQRARASRGQPA